MTSEFVQTTAGKAEDLNEQRVALMDNSNDALTKNKGQKPVSRGQTHDAVTSNKL